jgi:hypothetical protein
MSCRVNRSASGDPQLADCRVLIPLEKKGEKPLAKREHHWTVSDIDFFAFSDAKEFSLDKTMLHNPTALSSGL